ncbi:hypothetical protein VB714_05850 [Spirulina sp. 06S082]|nr:hypothetical protein [Spirulina sp. 06S082]
MTPSLTPILDAYREKHRYYHTLQHIEECLILYDRLPTKSPTVEIALWFHDVIYNPQGPNNEMQSANYADGASNLIYNLKWPDPYTLNDEI